jgi:hypothetical protein
MNSRLGLLFRLVVFKDLQKLVSQQQRDNRRKELFERLRNKPFWVWDIAEHKQEDRIKKLFSSTRGVTIFDSKETVIDLNGVKIEAFPSHHLCSLYH